MGRRDHYHVYVIELSKDVLYESRFKKADAALYAAKRGGKRTYREAGASGV